MERIQTEIEETEGIHLIKREYRLSDFTPEPDFVVVASDKKEDKKFISDYCKARRIPVNVVDEEVNYIIKDNFYCSANSIGL